MSVLRDWSDHARSQRQQARLRGRRVHVGLRLPRQPEQQRRVCHLLHLDSGMPALSPSVSVLKQAIALMQK